METLISDLKKIMNSEIEDKDKYMKLLINGFLRERDSELLTIQGVVKSLKVKQTLNFRDWTEENNIGLDEDGQWFISVKGDVDIDTLVDMHVRDVYL